MAGVDTLVLRELGGLGRGSFSVAREWTDRADACPYQALGLPPCRFNGTLLLELTKLLEQLARPNRHHSSHCKDIDK